MALSGDRPEAVTQRIETAFSAIQRTRMADVPILNHRLAVAAIGTRRWNDDWLSILVTPWCMNILLLPGSETMPGWIDFRTGESVSVQLPSGSYGFVAGEEPGLGKFRVCSLFSPMHEFADQAAAIATAEAAIAELLAPPIEEEHAAKTASARSRRSLFGFHQDRPEGGK